MSLQLVFALIILRTSQGYQAFKFLGDTVTAFLEYTDVGSAFVFGNDFETRYVAFKVTQQRISLQYKTTFVCSPLGNGRKVSSKR